MHVSTTTRLHGLRDYAESVATSPTVDDLVTCSLRAATVSVVGASTVYMCRYDATGQRVQVRHGSGKQTGWLAAGVDDRSFLIGKHARITSAVGGREPTWTGSVDDDDISAADLDFLVRLGTRHAAAFQVSVAGRLWGALYVTRIDSGFDTNDRAAGSALAALMAAGLCRLNLAKDLSDLAYTDALTGLANRRVADDWLHQRLSANEPFPVVAALLCDINGLKQVNDQYGHGTGDELVRCAATALITAVGDMDDVMVARIGGDEFVILLDHTTEVAVGALVQRVAGLVLPHNRGLAVGAATTRTRPAGTRTPQSAAGALLRLADAAQYEHKQTQRLSITATVASVSNSPLLPVAASGVSDRVLAAFRLHPGTSIEHRLQTVCDAVAEAYDAATWWVNKRDDDVVVDALGRVLRTDVRGQLAGIDHASGEGFDPLDYPATDMALEGGSYFASLTEGDLSERALLARMGYVSVVAAGDTAANGTSWLVEVFGDPQTSSSLFAAESSLRALVHIAITGGGEQSNQPSHPDNNVIALPGQRLSMSSPTHAENAAHAFRHGH